MRAAPPHHAPDGGFRDPWPDGVRFPGPRDVLRWQVERMRHPRPPAPPREALPTGTPDPAVPRERPGHLRVTNVGHATALVQAGTLNVLTDPVWSHRVSPLRWVGPGRLLPPGLAFEALPPVDLVLLSHDHYDHLDAPTVRRTAERFPDAPWVTPLGYRPWLERRGVRRVVELDWWEEASVETAGGVARVTALPARHWTRRAPWDFRKRLWSGFALAGPGGERLYFAGDSGWMPEFPRIGERVGPFDVLLLPIGAYAPRWFMRSSHMNPEEAVAAYRALGAQGLFVGIHWGVFRLADDAVLEPPARTREAWAAAGLAPADLALPPPGATVRATAAARTSFPSTPHPDGGAR